MLTTRPQIILAILSVLSCTHQSGDSSGPQSPAPTQPPPKPATSEASAASGKNIEAEAGKYGLILQEQVRVFRSLEAGEGALSQAEAAKVRAIAQQATRNVAENAILCIAAARASLAKQDPMREGGDLDSRDSSLESLSSKFDVKFARSMELNPMLVSPRFLLLVQNSIEMANNSPAFDAEVRRALMANAPAWQRLAASLGIAAATGGAAQGAPASEEPAEATAQDSSEGPAMGTAVDVDSQTVLDKAAELAEKGEYKQAIQLLVQAPADTPAFQVARQRIVTYSDSAVQYLRTRSATEFQNSQQVADDPSARLAYLKKSSSFLESAITDFPEASMIQTVRSNLDFVKREIAKVEGQVSRR